MTTLILNSDHFIRYLKPRRTSRHVVRHRLGVRFVMYSLYAWVVPFLIVLLGQILERSQLPEYIIRPRFGKIKCWFSGASKSPRRHFYIACYTLSVTNFRWWIEMGLFVRSRSDFDPEQHCFLRPDSATVAQGQQRRSFRNQQFKHQTKVISIYRLF